MAEEECEALIVERRGTRNTGNVVDDEKTAFTEPEV